MFHRPVVARFDQQHGSSDGGAVLLKAVDKRLGLLERLAGCLRDGRQPGKIGDEIGELPAQRVYSIARGAPDTNDIPRQRKVAAAVWRVPLQGQTLAVRVPDTHRWPLKRRTTAFTNKTD